MRICNTSDYNRYETLRRTPRSAMKRVQESRIVENSMYGLTRGAG
jgi:hypothetical protein